MVLHDGDLGAVYELAALLAAARWVAEGAEGEMPREAIDQLRQVVESYDIAWQQFRKDT
jgi:fructose-1,6-bisphosphatase/sedoheptulose 1,7-bisphosphatase-like protein